MNKMSGAKILLESLLREKVEVIFGIPGGAVLPIYDELYKYRRRMRHILMRHEQAAAHAADAYARISGKVGVCLATSGPGATNLVTGLATAMLDSIPLVAITGNVSSHLLGNDAFQETDIIGVTQSITKHNYLVTRSQEIAPVIKEAFYIASTGRPGPVHIDITKDAQTNQAIFRYPQKANLPGYLEEPVKARADEIKKVIQLIGEARQPLIIAGHGIIIASAGRELKELVALTDMPVVNTLLGLGSFAQNDSHWLGMLGMHGLAAANYAVAEADLIIALGVRFSDRITGDLGKFQQDTKFVHFDIDPAEFGKNVRARVMVGGDLQRTLTLLNSKLKTQSSKLRLKTPSWRQWWERIDAWRSRYQFKEIDREDLKLSRSKLARKGHADSARQSPLKRELTTPEVVSLISYLTKGQAIVTTGVGQHQMFVSQYYRFNRSGSLATSGGSGTMGYGLPSVIGARVGARTGDEVWAIDGDGSFQMTEQELGTIKQENLNVKIVIINNGYLGMVKQWQDMFYGQRLSGVHLASGSPDFVKLAQSYEIKARRVTSWPEAVRAVKWARDYQGPVVLDCWVNPNEHVYPMVLAGGALGDQILDNKAL